jgi:hypothetical protein
MYAAQGDYIKAFESYDAAANIDKPLDLIGPEVTPG